MCKFIKNALVTGQNMNLWEIGMSKIYLVVISILISLWFPVILGLNVYFYLFLFIVLDILAILSLIKKEGNFLKKLAKKKFDYKFFKNYGFWDFSIFKITLASFGLLLAKAFPVILTFDIGFYFIIFGFGTGYFVSSFLKK